MDSAAAETNHTRPFLWGVATSPYQSEGGYNGPGQPQTNWASAEARNDVDSVLRGLENRLALIHSSRLLPGVTDLPDDGSGISYRLEVVQVQLVDQKKASVPNIYRATISATWKSHGDVNERDVSELVYQP